MSVLISWVLLKAAAVREREICLSVHFDPFKSFALLWKTKKQSEMEMDQKHKATHSWYFSFNRWCCSGSRVKDQPWPTTLAAPAVAGVFPRWYPDKWLTEDDNPQNNEIGGPGGGGLPWSVRDSSWSKAVAENWHQHGCKNKPVAAPLYFRHLWQRNLQKTTNRVWFGGLEQITLIEPVHKEK